MKLTPQNVSRALKAAGFQRSETETGAITRFQSWDEGFYVAGARERGGNTNPGYVDRKWPWREVWVHWSGGGSSFGGGVKGKRDEMIPRMLTALKARGFTVEEYRNADVYALVVKP